MLKVKEIGETEVTKISCPKCKERLPRVGLLKNSTVDGLTFKCKRCGKFFAVRTE